MTKLEVNSISKETIKPSSPTPHYLHNFKRSFLDQLAPPIFFPITLFYPPNSILSKTQYSKQSDSLKKSLSKTLTRFYPAAGRLEDDDGSVNCNDDGVDYFETQVNCQLSEILRQPDAGILTQLLPHDLIGTGTCLLLAIQVNIFECGGMAIGICISHKIADASSLATLINDWASTVRGTSEVVGPYLQLASIFPPRDLSDGFMASSCIAKEKIVTKRFLFDNSKIAALKAKVSANDSNVKHPTRVETVSALIWRAAMASARVKPGEPVKKYAALHAVNMKRRMNPPLPDHYFGNMCLDAITPATTPEREYTDLVVSIREAIKGINDNYEKNLSADDINEASELFNGEMEVLGFSSWCRFGWYEVDFGWGKPDWVCSSLPIKNSVVLLDTKSGDGIEAWVTMLEEDIEGFERDPELLTFVS